MDGQRWEMIKNTSGDILQLSAQEGQPDEIQVMNNLMQGSINAYIYKDGSLFATKSNIAPGQFAAFSFKPTIFIGVVSQVVEGEIMNSAVMSSINTEISLLGIASADIVMTGGGPGTNSEPFRFDLANLVYA